MGLLAQMDQLVEIIGPINEEHTFFAYEQIFILTNGARALMDPCDWYTFKFKKRGMWTVYSQGAPMNVYLICSSTME